MHISRGGAWLETVRFGAWINSQLYASRRCASPTQQLAGLSMLLCAEFVVDLAIAHGKPFAVVPCCVFPGDFPR